MASQSRAQQAETSEAQDLRVRPAWVTYRYAEAYCSLSRVTLWRLIRAGDIKAVHVGRAVRISVASLDEFLARQGFGKAS